MAGLTLLSTATVNEEDNGTILRKIWVRNFDLVRMYFKC
jgi:hypothetical protein